MTKHDAVRHCLSVRRRYSVLNPPSPYLDFLGQNADRRLATDTSGSPFDADALAFGVPDWFLECIDEESIPIPPFPRLSQSRS